MAINIDIFKPQVSVVAKGLAGKKILIYGGNNVGKSYAAAHMSKPFFLACENGLNALPGIMYAPISNWRDFKKVVKQFTDKSTVDKAREMYDTIVIDEVYASSLFCQDYVMATYGNGALTLADGDSKHNLYSIYEKEYFKMINLLVSCDYTICFIGHAQEKDSKMWPKGDKRCINPIVDTCDFVIYVKSNGVDENGHLIKSSGYFVETDKWFARSRFTYCPEKIEEFSAENLEKAVIEAIENEEKASGIAAVSFDEQKAMNAAPTLDFNELMEEIKTLGRAFGEAGKLDILTEIVESTLGSGKKVTECTKKQAEAVAVIRDDLTDKAKELGLLNN